MASSFADALYRALLDAFPAARSYTASDFFTPPMPAPVGAYLSHWARAQARADAQRLALPDAAWIDAEHEAVRDALATCSAALAEQPCIPVAAWPEALRTATAHVVDYLVRPVLTLADHAFVDITSGDGSADRPVGAIQERLRWFTAYGYFDEILDAYIEQRDLTDLTRDRLLALLKRIDRQMTSDYEAEQWVQLLEPLFDLAARTPGRDGVPAELVVVFFREKGARAQADALRAATQDQPQEPLTADRLRDVLEAPAPAPSPAGSAAPAPALAPPISDAEGPVPLWKQFQDQRFRQPKVQSRPEPPAPAAPRPAPATPGSQVPRWMQFRSGQAPAETVSEQASAPDRPAPRPTQPTPSAAPAPRPASPRGADPELDQLEAEALGPRGAPNRDLFVRHLFAGSTPEYRDVLEKLRGAPTWQHASRIIAQDVFRRHQVNIYSEPAVVFTDAVEARYRDAA